MKKVGTQREDALRLLVSDLGPRLLEHLSQLDPDIEDARRLHTELRKILEHLCEEPTW